MHRLKKTPPAVAREALLHGTPSARYVAKMEDVWDVYQRPYDLARPLVCLDEVSTELHSTPHGELGPQLGKTACQDYEYVRRGMVNLFMPVEPLPAQRRVRITDRRTAVDFADEQRQLAQHGGV